MVPRYEMTSPIVTFFWGPIVIPICIQDGPGLQPGAPVGSEAVLAGNP